MKFEPQIFAVVAPRTAVPDDDALASFSAMHQGVEALPASTLLGEPILPCQRPRIEVTVLDADNAPLADIPYRLLLEDKTLAEGTLDGFGYVAVDEKEVPPGAWQIEITLQRNSTTQKVERADIVLTSAPTVTEAEGAEEDDESVEDVAWLPFIEPPYRPAA